MSLPRSTASNFKTTSPRNVAQEPGRSAGWLLGPGQRLVRLLQLPVRLGLVAGSVWLASQLMLHSGSRPTEPTPLEQATDWAARITVLVAEGPVGTAARGSGDHPALALTSLELGDLVVDAASSAADQTEHLGQDEPTGPSPTLVAVAPPPPAEALLERNPAPRPVAAPASGLVTAARFQTPTRANLTPEPSLIQLGERSLASELAGRPTTGEADQAAGNEASERPEPVATETVSATSGPSTAPPPGQQQPWVAVHRETGLWSGPLTGQLFSLATPGAHFQVARAQDGPRLYVWNPETRNYAYITALDVGPAKRPSDKPKEPAARQPTATAHQSIIDPRGPPLGLPPAFWSGTARVTMYTCVELGGCNRTASGIWPYEGVVAVDPRVIPLGSTVWLDGLGHFLAADTGSAVYGNRIDVFVHDYHRAIRWGVRYLDAAAFRK